MLISKHGLITLATLFTLTSSVNAQVSALTVKQLELFSLEQQIPELPTHNIRARRITVPAGGIIEKHEHSTRAGIVYVESGEIIEYRYKDNQKHSRKVIAGETLVEDAATVHSYINQNNKDCVLIAFDLPMKES